MMDLSRSDLEIEIWASSKQHLIDMMARSGPPDPEEISIHLIRRYRVTVKWPNKRQPRPRRRGRIKSGLICDKYGISALRQGREVWDISLSYGGYETRQFLFDRYTRTRFKFIAKFRDNLTPDVGA